MMNDTQIQLTEIVRVEQKRWGWRAYSRTTDGNVIPMTAKERNILRRRLSDRGITDSDLRRNNLLG